MLCVLKSRGARCCCTADPLFLSGLLHVAPAQLRPDAPPESPAAPPPPSAASGLGLRVHVLLAAAARRADERDCVGREGGAHPAAALPARGRPLFLPGTGLRHACPSLHGSSIGSARGCAVPGALLCVPAWVDGRIPGQPRNQQPGGSGTFVLGRVHLTLPLKPAAPSPKGGPPPPLPPAGAGQGGGAQPVPLAVQGLADHPRRLHHRRPRAGEAQQEGCRLPCC